jgi:DNA-binding PadR family transcriptional regulator
MSPTAPAAPSRPIAPTTIEASGLSVDLITELVVKTLLRSSELSAAEISRRMGLNYALISPSLETMKRERLCEITGGPSLGGPSFRYRLTDAGRQRAARALDENQYIGVAPISAEQYWDYTNDFRKKQRRSVTAAEVRAAFSHLIVSDRVLDEIGPAVNSGHSIFMYGPPGNGKTVMSRAIRSLLTGTMAIPHAIEVAGHIIRFYDPTVHEAVPRPESDRDETPYDHRWIECRRPMVAVGGELTLEELSLIHNTRSGVYRAPVQMLANGGVLLIDEFGRQRCHPRDLLNWWMVPLESGFEMLSLASGEKIEMPFFPLVIFSTNLRPSELVDEAFLRRIQYKIYAESPSPRDFLHIFANECENRGISFDPEIVQQMLDTTYAARGIELRGCHPRDLINQALALASYRGEPARLTATLLEEACDSYFIDDHENRA